MEGRKKRNVANKPSKLQSPATQCQMAPHLTFRKIIFNPQEVFAYALNSV
jgi:hypothetical protein